jgi:hypothetical protein
MRERFILTHMPLIVVAKAQERYERKMFSK